MGGRGNAAVRNSRLNISPEFQSFLDKTDDESMAIRDYLYENYLPNHITYKNKEWEISFQNGIREKIVERPTGETFSKDLVVTATIDLYDPDTGETVNNYTIKDEINSKKPKKFHIPYYD